MRILGLAGRKGSGKDSSAKIILGSALRQADVIDKIDMDADGNLLVNYATRLDDGKVEQGMGVFDLDRADPAFMYYLQEQIWPHAKIYHFADTLKWIGINLYGLPYESMYGTNDEKNSLTDHTWKKMLDVLPKAVRPTGVNKDEQLTARQFIQHFADVCRYLDDGCFTKSLMQRILLEQCPFAIVADVRRVTEVETIKACGGKVIYHTRQIDEDKHHTETEFDNIDKSIFDFVVDNRVCTLQEKNQIVLAQVKEWGWL